MKILILYFSNTGNTKKVAKSMAKGLASEEIDLLKVQDTFPDSLKLYDLILLGSGIYAGKVSKNILTFIKDADELPKSFALFCTHASVDHYQDGFKMVKKNIKKAGSEIIAEWDCRGENIGIPEEQRKAMLDALPPEQRKQAEEDQERLKGHPNTEDLENAEKFARSLLNKM